MGEGESDKAGVVRGKKLPTNSNLTGPKLKMYKGYLKNSLTVMFVALFMAVLAIVIGIALPDYYGGSITSHPFASIFVVFIMMIFGFFIGLLEGYFLRDVKIKPLLKDGLLGVIFVFTFSLALSLFTSFFAAGRINVFPIFVFSFLIWVIPGFLLGILSGFILKKLKIES